MVTTNQIRDEYRLEATSVGVEGVVASGQRLAASNQQIAASTEQVERKSISVSGAVDRFARSNDNLYRMQQVVQRGQALLNRAFEQGLSGTVAYERASAALVARQEQLAVASARAAAATRQAAEAQAQAVAAASRKVGSLSYSPAGSFFSDQDISKQRAALIPLVAAQQQYEAALGEANAAAKANVITERERAAIVATARGRLLDQTNEIRKAEDANARLTKGVGLNAYAWQNLSYQVNDVVTSLASGISPFQTLAQQGGQIYQILQSGQGGVGGALSAIKDRLLAISPLVGVFGALAAGAVLATVAAVQYANAQRDVRLALLGVGQGAGVSVEQIDLIARRAADSAQISISAAREIELEFLKTGRVFGDVFLQGTIAAENFSKATKQDRGTAAAFVAQNLSTLGAGGYEELAKKAGNFDAALDRQVRSLLDSGNEVEAQRVVLERFGQAYDKVGEKLSFIDQRLGEVSRGWDSFKNALARGLSGSEKSLAQQLDETEKALSTRRQFVPQDDPQVRVLEERSRRLQSAIRETGQESQKTAEATQRNLDSLDKRAVQAAVPDAANLDRVQEQLRQANKTLNALESRGGSAAQIESAKKAISGLSAAERDFAAAGGPANMERAKANELLKAGLQSMQAVSPEQKAEAARQQALAETFGTVTSAQERTARASDAYNRSLAEQREASKRASDAQGESTKTTNLQADAVSRAGKSIEYLTARRKAEEEAAAGTIRQDEVAGKTQEYLQSQLAQVSKQYAERKRALADQVSIQKGVNDQVAAGTLKSAEAQRQIANLTELQKLGIERDAASGETKQILAQRYDELAAAQRAQMSEEDRGRVQGLAEDEQRRITLLTKEIGLLGESVQVRNRELAILQAKQGLGRQGISASSPESKDYLNKVALRSDLDTMLREYERTAQEISGIVAGIFDDLLNNSSKGMAGVLGNLSKSFARLGTRYIEQNVLAPILTQGATGVAANDNGGGPSFANLLKSSITEGAEKGTAAGAAAGTETGLSFLTKGSGFGSMARGAVGGLSILSSYGAGANAQSTSQAVLGGAMSGAVGGAMLGAELGAVGGPLGAAVGAAIGIGFSLFGKSEADKAKRKAEQEQYKQDRIQIEQFRAGLRGESSSGVEATIKQAYAQAQEAAVKAQKAGDKLMVDAIWRDYYDFVARTRATFREAFRGTLAEIQAGFGTNGAYAQAVATMIQFGQSLKGFISDAQGISPEAGNRATEAAWEAAVQSLQKPPALSEIETELKRIDGTGAGLVTVLTQLGLAAEQVGDVIRERTTVAINALRASFEQDLGRKLNDAQDRGYINELSDLLKERQSLLRDATLLGSDAAQVEAYITAAAQKIVNGAELTGDAFTALTRQFPDLVGRVREFSAAVDEAARKAAIASRVLGYQDRLFAAGNDTSTLAGQLAAYDRQAQRDRQEEIKAGGEAIADLEAAQYAERLKIVIDYQQQAADAERQRMEAAQQAFDAFARTIKQFVDQMRAGTGSPLSPQARLAEAQAQFTAQRALAQSGNRDALDGITGYASTLLDAAKAFYASSSGYQTIFEQVASQLTALPTQVSAEQFIVNAIDASKAAIVSATQAMQAALKTAIDAGSASATASALLPQFSNLTSTTAGLLNYQQFVSATGGLATISEQQIARNIFNSIDADGDGQISRLELIRAQAQGIKDSSDIGNNTANQINSQTAGTKTATEQANNFLNAINTFTNQTQAGVNASKLVLDALGGLATIQRDQLIALNNQFSNNSYMVLNGTVLNNNMVTALNKIVYNTAGTWSAVQKGAVPAAYSTGGWVRGGGTATSDSIPAVLSNGEYVVKADVARMHGSLLETLNGTGTLNLRAMNDNRFAGMPSVVTPMPMPVMMGGGSDNATLVSALKEQIALQREQIGLLRMQIETTAAGARHVGEKVDEHRSETKRGRDDARQVANRPRTAGTQAA